MPISIIIFSDNSYKGSSHQIQLHFSLVEGAVEFFVGLVVGVYGEPTTLLQAA